MCSFFNNQKTGWALQFMPTPDFSSPPRRPLPLIWGPLWCQDRGPFQPQSVSICGDSSLQRPVVASLQYVVSLFYAFIRENHYWWLPCCVYRLYLAIIYIGCYARLCVVSVGIASEKGEAYLQCSPVWFSRCLCYSVFVASSLADCAHARMHTQTTVAKCDLCLT